MYSTKKILAVYCSKLSGDSGSLIKLQYDFNRENLNDREGQTDSTSIKKYLLVWLKKAFDVTLNFNFK